MATIRQRSAGSWEIIIRRKGILPKPHYASAETEDEARAYAFGVERLLDQGIFAGGVAGLCPASGADGRCVG